MGCVTQVGEQAFNVGRIASLVAGWPENGRRDDGRSAVRLLDAGGVQRRGRDQAGQLDVVVSAGVEMMSRVPMGSNGSDLSEQMAERWPIVPQGISAEEIAEEWKISRERLDELLARVDRRALAAIEAGKFENEIVLSRSTQPARR